MPGNSSGGRTPGGNCGGKGKGNGNGSGKPGTPLAVAPGSGSPAVADDTGTMDTCIAAEPPLRGEAAAAVADAATGVDSDVPGTDDADDKAATVGAPLAVPPCNASVTPTAA